MTTENNPDEVPNESTDDTLVGGDNDSVPDADADAASGDTVDAGSKDDDKPKREAWFTKAQQKMEARIKELVAEKTAAYEEIAQLKSGKPSADLTAEVRAQLKAEAKAEVEADVRIERFNSTCDRIFDEGLKDNPEFKDVSKRLVDAGFLFDSRGTPTSLMEAVVDLPNAHKILSYLGDDIDEVTRISSLPPLRQAYELARIEAKIESPAKAGVSRAPDPIRPISAKPKIDPDIYNSKKMSMDDWAALREKQEREKYQAEKA